LTLSPEQRQRLAVYADQPVVLGIRPEGVRPAVGAGTDSTLRITVSVVEPLGDRMDVHARVGDTPFVCRIEAGQAIREGEAVQMQVDMTRVHFFEPGPAGRNIGRGGE
jgi:multiple sugar transport system ATP-binding protein